MSDPDERETQSAVADEAIERLEQHDHERDAKHRQGLIEKETRERGLDDS